jgi:hypothetical protein
MPLTEIHIALTDDTPEVVFDAQHSIFRMKGRSLPENAYNFYRPLLEWAKEFCAQQSQPAVFEFELDYFNSSSGRFIFELLTIMEAAPKGKSLFTIRWKAEADDELMIEKGEELQSLVDLHFELILL